MPKTNHKDHRFICCLALALFSLMSLQAHSQNPVDSDVWKSRCLQLSAQADAIDRGSAPPELLQSTKGIPGAKFAAVGSERANAGQHYIACTMYYTAALAEHQGNGGKIDTGRAHTDIVLGGAEAKRAAGLPLSFKEKLDRASGKINPAGKGSLTPGDLAAVYAAFGEGGGPPPSNSWGNGGQTPNSGGYNPTLNPSNRPSGRNNTPPQYPTQPNSAPQPTPSQGSSPWSR